MVRPCGYISSLHGLLLSLLVMESSYLRVILYYVFRWSGPFSFMRVQAQVCRKTKKQFSGVILLVAIGECGGGGGFLDPCICVGFSGFRTRCVNKCMVL